MRCIVCDSDKWKNVDHWRGTPLELVKEHGAGMAQCEECGFVSYPNKYQSYEAIKAYYRTAYRPAPNVQNLCSGERKLHYHEVVLRPWIEQWKSAERPPVIGEVGSAMGMFLSWMKQQIPQAEVHGTELTTSYRRVAKHEFGIDLVEELPEKKYDMIASYHVLEHQMDADWWLAAYAKMLSEQGVIYLSTPIWFREATNFGSQGFDLDYYWHPDHINCWSQEHLELIIWKAGLEIIYKNDNIYGNTYILRKLQGEPAHKPELALPGVYAKRGEDLLRCWRHIQSNETDLAIEAYPNCPAAWINHYELNRAKLDKDKKALSEFLNSAVKACPNTADTLTLAADVNVRYEEFKNAIALFKQALKRKPNNPTLLFGLANCFRQIALKTKNEDEKMAALNESLAIMKHARATSIELANQATSWIYHDYSLIPIGGE